MSQTLSLRVMREEEILSSKMTQLAFLTSTVASSVGSMPPAVSEMAPKAELAAQDHGYVPYIHSSSVCSLIALPVQLPALPNMFWKRKRTPLQRMWERWTLRRPYSPPAPTHTAVQPPATPESIQPLPETMPSSLAPQPMPEATPLSTFTSASTPTTTRQRIVGHSQSSFSPSAVPTPLDRIDSVDIDSMDDLCDCGGRRLRWQRGRRRCMNWIVDGLWRLLRCNLGRLRLTGAEYLRKSIDKALILFWIPMMIGVLCLALFRLVATNEDMDNLVAKFVTINTAFLHNLREMLHGLRSHVQNGRGAFNELWNAAAAR
ncbi:hypothetical protein BC829DRAFT_385105 [Chytridium lagenaria]|nr:hypothetical protein BC829DRAFT_385105 [Chytridium lagenaria]